MPFPFNLQKDEFRIIMKIILNLGIHKIEVELADKKQKHEEKMKYF